MSKVQLMRTTVFKKTGKKKYSKHFVIIPKLIMKVLDLGKGDDIIFELREQLNHEKHHRERNRPSYFKELGNYVQRDEWRRRERFSSTINSWGLTPLYMISTEPFKRDGILLL